MCLYFIWDIIYKTKLDNQEDVDVSIMMFFFLFLKDVL